MVGRVDGEIEARQIKLITASGNEGLIDRLSLSIGSIGEFLERLRVLLEVVEHFRANLLNEVLTVGAGSINIHLVHEVGLAEADPVGNGAGPILLVDLDNAFAGGLGYAAHAAGIARHRLLVRSIIVGCGSSSLAAGNW